MKTISYNATGPKLWVRFTTLGLYHISFTYDLLEKDGLPGNPPRILTRPIIASDNLDKKQTHAFRVQNVFQPGEDLNAFDGRFINTSFLIIRLQDDRGYEIAVDLLQGDDPETAAALGGDANPSDDNTLGDARNRSLDIKFKIVKQ